MRSKISLVVTTNLFDVDNFLPLEHVGLTLELLMVGFSRTKCSITVHQSGCRGIGLLFQNNAHGHVVSQDAEAHSCDHISGDYRGLLLDSNKFESDFKCGVGVKLRTKLIRPHVFPKRFQNRVVIRDDHL